jgi:hypothetical protein
MFEDTITRGADDDVGGPSGKTKNRFLNISAFSLGQQLFFFFIYSRLNSRFLLLELDTRNKAEEENFLEIRNFPRTCRFADRSMSFIASEQIN